jgi:uncharacterized delta-60 repeat protein
MKSSHSNVVRSLGVLALMVGLGAGVTACDNDNTPSQTGGGGSGGKGGNTGSAGTTGKAGSSPDGSAGTTGVAGADGGSPDTSDAAGTGAAGTGAAGTGAAGTGAAGTGAAGMATLVDTDAVLARFNADGTPDTAFGGLGTGVARVDLGTGALVGTASVRDAPWGIAKDAQDRVLIFATRRSTAAGRVDADRVVARVRTNGSLDTSFGDMGFHSFGIGTLSDSARHGRVDPDGKIVSSGYTNQPTGVGAQTANRIVVARLNGGDVATPDGGAPDGGDGGASDGGAADAGAPANGPGTFDTTFGVGGILNHNPFASTSPTMLWGMAECYGIARQTTGNYVTTGYGRLAPSGQVNVVSFRYTPTGAFDMNWGTNGIFEKDLTTDNDRGRQIVALPDDRLLIAGSATPSAMNVDGLLMMLTPNGGMDTTFNTTGYKTYKFDQTTDRTDEALYDVSVSPNGMFAAAAGYRAARMPMTMTATDNDDAVLVILPLGGAGSEFAAATPLSAGTADRFWGVTFDANNKVVAAGFVAEGNDRWLAVARFNTDGTKDTTFGGGTGMAKVNVKAKADDTIETALGVVVQTDGKIVIGGVAER